MLWLSAVDLLQTRFRSSCWQIKLHPVSCCHWLSVLIPILGHMFFLVRTCDVQASCKGFGGEVQIHVEVLVPDNSFGFAEELKGESWVELSHHSPITAHCQIEVQIDNSRCYCVNNA